MLFSKPINSRGVFCSAFDLALSVHCVANIATYPHRLQCVCDFFRRQKLGYSAECSRLGVWPKCCMIVRAHGI